MNTSFIISRKRKLDLTEGKELECDTNENEPSAHHQQPTNSSQTDVLNEPRPIPAKTHVQSIFHKYNVSKIDKIAQTMTLEQFISTNKEMVNLLLRKEDNPEMHEAMLQNQIKILQFLKEARKRSDIIECQQIDPISPLITTTKLAVSAYHVHGVYKQIGFVNNAAHYKFNQKVTSYCEIYKLKIPLIGLDISELFVWLLVDCATRKEVPKFAGTIRYFSLAGDTQTTRPHRDASWYANNDNPKLLLKNVMSVSVRLMNNTTLKLVSDSADSGDINNNIVKQSDVPMRLVHNAFKNINRFPPSAVITSTTIDESELFLTDEPPSTQQIADNINNATHLKPDQQQQTISSAHEILLNTHLNNSATNHSTYCEGQNDSVTLQSVAQQHNNRSNSVNHHFISILVGKFPTLTRSTAKRAMLQENARIAAELTLSEQTVAVITVLFSQFMLGLQEQLLRCQSTDATSAVSSSTLSGDYDEICVSILSVLFRPLPADVIESSLMDLMIDIEAVNDSLADGVAIVPIYCYCVMLNQYF